jgi:dolichol-phosphate mannosyltransferase
MASSWKDSTLAIIPTYNECIGIRPLVAELLTLYPKIHICVVDDDSPDGTGEVVEDLAREHDGKVFVVHRTEKSGRGSAVVEGLQFGLSQSRYKYFVEMDSDFSHAPKEFQRLMEQADSYDIVIGSRYLPDSRIVNWPLKRRLFSRCANFLIHFLLKIPISDYTNGFRCYSLKAVEKLNFDQVQGAGFVVLSSLAYQLHLKGFSFGEVHTRFVNRVRGESKFTLTEVLHSFFTVWKIKDKSKNKP